MHKTMTQQPDHDDTAPQKPRRRPRRATVPGTGPVQADGPEPKLEDLTPAPARRETKKLDERERWMLEEKPPHY